MKMKKIIGVDYNFGVTSKMRRDNNNFIIN